MSEALMINGRPLLPIKDVVRRSRYTRDYIAKLAREGVIVGVQVGRQWFIDESSLQSFTEVSELEAEVRRRHLSGERRRERDLREEVERQWDVMPMQPRYQPLRAVVATVAVFCVGVFSAFVIQLVPATVSDVATLWPVPKVGVGIGALPHLPSVLAEPQVKFPAITSTEEETIPLVFSDIKTSDSFIATSAVLFISEQAATSAAAVAAIFSDPVTVTFTASGTGVVMGSSGVGTTTVPFVRVPLTVARDGDSGVMPIVP